MLDSMTNTERAELLRSLLKRRILVIDGAMGTSVQDRQLEAEDFDGPQYEGCNEYLVLVKPEVIADIHQSFLDAGADILETDTFGATSVVLPSTAYPMKREGSTVTQPSLHGDWPMQPVPLTNPGLSQGQWGQPLRPSP